MKGGGLEGWSSRRPAGWPHLVFSLIVIFIFIIVSVSFWARSGASERPTQPYPTMLCSGQGQLPTARGHGNNGREGIALRVRTPAGTVWSARRTAWGRSCPP